MPENRLPKNAVALLLLLPVFLAESAPASAAAQKQGSPQSRPEMETKQTERIFDGASEQAGGRIFDGACTLGESKGAQDAKSLLGEASKARPDSQGPNMAGSPRPLPLQAKPGIGDAKEGRHCLGSYSRLLERLEVAKLKTQIAKEEGALEKALQARREDGTQDVRRQIEAMERRLVALEGAAGKAGGGKASQGAEPKRGGAKPPSARPRAFPRIVSIQSDETGRFWAAAMDEKGKVVRIEQGSRWNGAKVQSVGRDGVVLSRPGSRSRL